MRCPIKALWWAWKFFVTMYTTISCVNQLELSERFLKTSPVLWLSGDFYSITCMKSVQILEAALLQERNIKESINPKSKMLPLLTLKIWSQTSNASLVRSPNWKGPSCRNRGCRFFFQANSQIISILTWEATNFVLLVSQRRFPDIESISGRRDEQIRDLLVPVNFLKFLLTLVHEK